MDQQFRVDDIKDKSNTNGTALAAFKPFHMVARLCNGAKFDQGTSGSLQDERAIKGDATDTALLRFAEPLALPAISVDTPTLLASYDNVFEIPFNPKNKWMLSVVREKIAGRDNDSKQPESWMLVKGAPDVLLPCCTDAMKADGSLISLDQTTRERVSTLQAEWSDTGLRVLALCRRSLDGVKVNPAIMSATEMEDEVYSELRNLTLIGLVGIRDPPRSDVTGAIEIIRRAGVRVFMVTGDFRLTAVAIARQVCVLNNFMELSHLRFQQVGIISQEKVDSIAEMRVSESARRVVNAPRPDVKPLDSAGLRALVISGQDMLSFSSEDWDIVAGYNEVVFARTTPEQKLQIVQELKARGDNIVAVTGDGVNDAPAMRGSDIGVAMGSGSDVAKEAGKPRSTA
jgi:sodium/potassium-transporting ATPase subunit alpha